MAEFTAPIVWHDLLALAAQDGLAWHPFHPGIEIHRLYGGHDDGPAAALLRYQPGAEAPVHMHEGIEHILVLHGAQEDEHGHYAAGSLLISPRGSIHHVRSLGGCVVLAIWQRPVRFLGREEHAG